MMRRILVFCLLFIAMVYVYQNCGSSSSDSSKSQETFSKPITIFDDIAYEGQDFEFVVQLQAVLDVDTIITYSTVISGEDSAEPGVDFAEVTNEEITIPAGSKKATIKIAALVDSDDDEQEETFHVVLNAVTPSMDLPEPALGTIAMGVGPTSTPTPTVTPGGTITPTPTLPPGTSPTPTPIVTTTPTATPTVTPTPTMEGLDAVVVSYNVPSEMHKGITWPVKIDVTVKNTGSVTWTKDKSIRFAPVPANGGSIWNNWGVDLSSSDSVAPGQTKTFSFSILPNTSAASPSPFHWAMHRSSTSFGGEVFKSVYLVSTEIYCVDGDRYDQPTSLGGNNYKVKQTVVYGMPYTDHCRPCGERDLGHAVQTVGHCLVEYHCYDDSKGNRKMTGTPYECQLDNSTGKTCSDGVCTIATPVITN